MVRLGPWTEKNRSTPSPPPTAVSAQSSKPRGSRRSQIAGSLPSSGPGSVVGADDEISGGGRKFMRNCALFWVRRPETTPQPATAQSQSGKKYAVQESRLVETIVLPPTERKNFFKPDAAAGWEGFYAKTLEAAKRPPTTAVVLLYCGEFSPFTTSDLDALQRARGALHSRYPEAQVVGAVVAPYPDKWCATAPPFRARVDLARKIVRGTRESDWIVVDGCLEACLRKCEGSVAPHVAVYARSRLLCPGCRAKVVEISTTDTLVATGEPIRPFDCLFVGRGGVEPAVEATPALSEIRSVLVDVPKHRLCGDALRAEAAAAIALGGLTRRDLLRIEPFE